MLFDHRQLQHNDYENYNDIEKIMLRRTYDENEIYSQGRTVKTSIMMTLYVCMSTGSCAHIKDILSRHYQALPFGKHLVDSKWFVRYSKWSQHFPYLSPLPLPQTNLQWGNQILGALRGLITTCMYIHGSMTTESSTWLYYSPLQLYMPIHGNMVRQVCLQWGNQTLGTLHGMITMYIYGSNST